MNLHSPEPVLFECKKCGWSGLVRSRPRCLACYREACRIWRQANPDKVLAKKRQENRRFFYERREEHNARRRKYRKPETNKRNRLIRLAWLASGDVTRQQLIDLYEASDRKCCYCQCTVEKARFTPTDPRGFDHIVARANGGRHTIENIVVSCGLCNARKAVLDVGRTLYAPCQ